MHVGAAQFLGRHHLAGRRLHQRRAAQEDRPLVLDDDRFVRHRRHIGAARGAGAHDDGDLRDAGGRQGGLVIEDAAEMLAVGEDLVLVRQVGAAGIHQIDAGQVVLAGDFLRAQVFLHRHRIIGAALDRGVVADHHAFDAGDAPDAGDDAGGRDVGVVHAVGRHLRQLEERRAGIQQRRTRSLGSILPRAVCFARAASPPPSLTFSTSARRSSTTACMAAALAAKSSDLTSIAERRTVMRKDLD